MGMTIDESLSNLKELQKDYQDFHDDVWQDPESYGVIAESLRIGIDTMCKYQKIQEQVELSEKENHKIDVARMIQIREFIYGND